MQAAELPPALPSLAFAEPIPPAPGARAARAAAIVVGLVAVVYGYQVILGDGFFPVQFPIRYVAYGLIFFVASAYVRDRRWAMALVLAPCAHHLWETSHPLALYIIGVVLAMYLVRERRRLFWATLVGLVVVGPKAIQSFAGLAPGSWLDLNQNLFVGLFLRYAYYDWERVRGFAPAGGFWEEAAYLLFVPQITGMLNLPPSEMAARWGLPSGIRRGFEAVLWAGVKIPALLWIEAKLLPDWGYQRGYEALQRQGMSLLWATLILAYVHWYLLVSAKFDLMIGLFRFFGVNVDENFRWPMLATSPVQLWRRWNIYNRRLLLKFVYFPLGGNRRRVYRNILATFIASALLLHTGFLGSPWWSVDPAQLRDWLLYFLAQGSLVCAAYWWLQRPFWNELAPAWRAALRCGGWAFTLASSAWLHVLPLAAGSLVNDASAPISSLGERLALMARALGWTPGG